MTEKKNADEAKQQEENKPEADAKDVEGANAEYENRTAGHVFGDTTSSNGQQNNPGQHGRDGGVANGTDNNPAPSEETIEGPNEERDGGDTNMAEETKREASKDQPKKL